MSVRKRPGVGRRKRGKSKGAPSQLDTYLAEQSQSGTESVGEFTLDPVGAMEKLARYQLADAGHWVVKVIQAGVVLGAREIRCTLNYNRTRVCFLGGNAVDGDRITRPCSPLSSLSKPGFATSSSGFARLSDRHLVP